MTHSKAALILSATALLAIPAIGSAHNATVACDASSPTWYRVTTDFNQLSPVTTYGPAGVTVTWSDRYTVTRPYPAGCTPPTPPVPPAQSPPPVVPEVVPETAAPPVITPGGPVEPEPVVRKAKPPKKVAYRCPRAKLPSYGWSLIVYRRHHRWCSYRVPKRPYSPPVAG